MEHPTILQRVLRLSQLVVFPVMIVMLWMIVQLMFETEAIEAQVTSNRISIQQNHDEMRVIEDGIQHQSNALDTIVGLLSRPPQASQIQKP
jgi:hypothetical protein